MTNKTKEILETINAKIIEKLELGVNPFNKPWMGGHVATNATTNKAYRGINYMLLNLLSPYKDHRFVTYKQAIDLGGNVRKGEKSLPVFYFSKFTKENEQGEQSTYAFWKHYSVFNVEQCENLDIAPLDYKTNKDIGSNEQADSIIRATGAIIHNIDQGKAFYSLIRDSITLPLKEQFHDDQGYYATLFHEIGHWTGHKTRLNREYGKRFGDHKYSIEELCAELTSAYLCNLVGYDSVLNHASYIGSWIKTLREKPEFIFNVSSNAQKAYDFVINRKQIKLTESEAV